MKVREGEEAGDSHDAPNLLTHFYTKVVTNITDATTKRERERLNINKELPLTFSNPKSN